mmetsp:Transcript_90355/g.292477  ORF Transcript_90355/g.292477 Transcript_90355/m.292477 type:complete len:217 (+) Transcript_90355:1292-1942(+)
MSHGALRQVDCHGGNVGVLALVEDPWRAGPRGPGHGLLPEVVRLDLGDWFLESLLADNQILQVHGRCWQQRSEVGEAQADGGGLHMAVEHRVVLQARAEGSHAALFCGPRAWRSTEDEIHLHIAAAVVHNCEVHVEGLRLQRPKAVVHQHYLVTALKDQQQLRAEKEALRGTGNAEAAEDAGSHHLSGVGERSGPHGLVDRAAASADLEGTGAGWS